MIDRKKDLRDTETSTGNPKALFSSAEPGQYVHRGFGPAAQKEAHARIDNEALAGDAGLLQYCNSFGEKGNDAVPHLGSGQFQPLRPAAALYRMHDDELALCCRQFRIERRIGKALDVVQVIDLSTDSEALHIRQKAVDGNRRSVALQPRNHRFEAADFLVRSHRLGVDIAGSRSKIDHLSTGGHERSRMGKRCLWVEEPAAIGK